MPQIHVEFRRGQSHFRGLQFHSEVNTRDGLATMRYLEGIQEGRRIQKQSDDRHFHRYSSQRDEALALSVRSSVCRSCPVVGHLVRAVSITWIFKIQYLLGRSLPLVSDNALALRPTIRAVRKEEDLVREAKNGGEEK